MTVFTSKAMREERGGNVGVDVGEDLGGDLGKREGAKGQRWRKRSGGDSWRLKTREEEGEIEEFGCWWVQSSRG